MIIIKNIKGRILEKHLCGAKITLEKIKTNSRI